VNYQELKEQKLYWEDLAIGEVFETPSRTITEADIVNFACLSADFNRLHVDTTYASQSAFGQRIAHGMLVVSVMSGLTTRMLLNHFIEDNLLGLLDMHVRFPKPVFVGDTIHVRVEVIDKNETSKPERGIVTFRRQAVDQRGQVAVEGEWKLLLRRRPR